MEELRYQLSIMVLSVMTLGTSVSYVCSKLIHDAVLLCCVVLVVSFASDVRLGISVCQRWARCVCVPFAPGFGQGL